MPENDEPIITCPRCDKQTDYPGHIVEGGAVLQCPFITVDVVIRPQEKKDKLV